MTLLLKVRPQGAVSSFACYCVTNPNSDLAAMQDIATLATLSDQGDFQDAAVYISGSSIEWVGRTADLPETYQHADTVLSLADHVVVPGLVNTHHHTFQGLTRCIAQVYKHVHLLTVLCPHAACCVQDSKLFGWLTCLYKCWEHLTVRACLLFPFRLPLKSVCRARMCMWLPSWPLPS